MATGFASRSGWFSRIVTRDDALKVISDVSKGFFFVAALQAVMAFVLGLTLLFDASLLAIGGFCLLKFHSRVAAVLLLLLTTAEAAVTVANRLGLAWGSGGGNVVLAAIILWAAIRGVEAAFKLNGRLAAGAPPPETSQF